ncbi:MAG TPA: magnesium and cobalt transport protein CorA [Alphaproteobacteria bacterium]|nr:magnesium and cobalt transport protein CorA [Alphaproteobacteria bacterium]
MLKVHATRDNCLKRCLETQTPVETAFDIPAGALWIDMISPGPAEREAVRELMHLEPPTREDMDEIEVSSRLYQEDGAVFMTALVMSRTDTAQPECQPISFVLKGDRLLTVRYTEPQPFATFAARAERQAGMWGKGDIILAGLLEAVIDRTADVLERIGGEIDQLSKEIFRSDPKRGNVDYQKVLVRLGQHNDLTSKARESLVSFARMLTFMTQALETKQNKEMKGHLKIMTRDVQSLSDHASYLSNKITFLLDAVLGIVNIEQSRIIKILSLAATVFLPPTLIASVYGMNFDVMPELKWMLGYPLALLLMVLSAVVPYYFFKWRGWL